MVLRPSPHTLEGDRQFCDSNIAPRIRILELFERNRHLQVRQLLEQSGWQKNEISFSIQSLACVQRTEGDLQFSLCKMFRNATMSAIAKSQRIDRVELAVEVECVGIWEDLFIPIPGLARGDDAGARCDCLPDVLMAEQTGNCGMNGLIHSPSRHRQRPPWPPVSLPSQSPDESGTVPRRTAWPETDLS